MIEFILLVVLTVFAVIQIGLVGAMIKAVFEHEGFRRVTPEPDIFEVARATEFLLNRDKNSTIIYLPDDINPLALNKAMTDIRDIQDRELDFKLRKLASSSGQGEER